MNVINRNRRREKKAIIDAYTFATNIINALIDARIE